MRSGRSAGGPPALRGCGCPSIPDAKYSLPEESVHASRPRCNAARWRGTRVTAAMQRVAVVAHVRHQRGALRCGPWRTCVTSRTRCVEAVAHVRHQRGALRCGRGARASPGGRVASRSWRTCATRRTRCVKVVAHTCATRRTRCVKVVTHVRHQRAALRHDTRERGRYALSSRTLLGHTR